MEKVALPPNSLFVLPGKPFLRYRPSLCSMAGSFSFEFQLVGGNLGVVLLDLGFGFDFDFMKCPKAWSMPKV